MTQDIRLENKLPDLGGTRELDQKEDGWASRILEPGLCSTGKELLQRRAQPTSRKIKVESENKGSKLEVATSLSSVPLKLKRGRPPKNKSVKQPSRGKVKTPAGTPKSLARKPEIKVPEPSSSSSKKSSENDSSLQKRKRGRPPKAQCSLVIPSVESPHKQDQPPKVAPSTESPRKRGRPPKAQSSAVITSTELPRKRGRPPKAQRFLVIPSTDSPRKRGRPPKIKSLEKLRQGEAQFPSDAHKSHIRKLETKASGLSSTRSETESSESNSCLKKRKQGRPPKVHGAPITPPPPDLPRKRHHSSKNKLPEINKGDVQPSPSVPTLHVMKLETKMPEPSSPRSRTSELPGEGEAQPSPSTPKPHAQKPGTSVSEPASSKSKTVSSENGCPLEKPKRGRPRKVPWAPAVPSVESPSKRKRGRPAKSPASPHMEVAVVCSRSASDRDTSAENEPPLPGRKRRRRWRKEDPVLAGSESSLDSEDGMAPPWQKEKPELDSETSALLPPQNAIPEAEPDSISLGENSASEHPPTRSTRSTAAVSSSKMGPISGSLRM
uniref:Uncharacterized protein n=1 Tax=Pelodiscus sinensis TaxID=13735 RepID=K7FA71_PELSI